MLCSWAALYFLFRWGGEGRVLAPHHAFVTSKSESEAIGCDTTVSNAAGVTFTDSDADLNNNNLKKIVPVIADFFPQENWHYKWHKSWYILLCHPLCYTWFIISQKLQVSLKSFLSGCCDLTLELLPESAPAVYPSGLWLTGSSCVQKKITLIQRRTLTLVLYIFALRGAFSSKKQLCSPAISHHQSAQHDLMRHNEGRWNSHTWTECFGQQCLYTVRLGAQRCFYYSTLNASQPF